jgi:hypothetical protein
MPFYKLLANKVILDINILNSFIKLIVFSKGNSFLIIFINNYSAETRITRVDLLKKTLKLNSRFNSRLSFTCLLLNKG